MDGFDSHSYKSLRGVDAYDRVWENIKGLKARDLELKVSFRVIINAINISNLEQILDRASLEGIDRVGFSPLDITSTSFGRQSLTDEKALSLMSEYLPSQQQIEKFRLLLKSSAKIGSAIESNLCDWNQEDFERCLKYYENLHYGQNPNYGDEICLFPVNSLVIDYDGGLKPCFYQDSIANIENPIEYQNKIQDTLNEIVRSKKCQNCRGKVFCDVQI
jgi:MoaA/NifB/PqqE/SkfB family radical SAM enzyme